jgi:hypothetical protein
LVTLTASAGCRNFSKVSAFGREKMHKAGDMPALSVQNDSLYIRFNHAIT